MLGALILLKEQRYIEAAEHLKWVVYWNKEDKKGGSHAAVELGKLYELGLGVEKNYPEALRLFNEALLSAKPVHLEAAFYLGEMYENGWGAEQNVSKAIGYYRQAANVNSDAKMRLDRLLGQ
jgi:TPR repeat protein